MRQQLDYNVVRFSNMEIDLDMIRATVLEILKTELDFSDLDGASDLVDSEYALDSLEVVQLLFTLEERFSCKLDPAHFGTEAFRTPDTIAAAVLKVISSS